MNRYKVVAQNEHLITVEAESVQRDGDWVILNNSMPAMETRVIDDPETASGKREIKVSSGRSVFAPVAIFFRPISVELMVEKPEEPSNGDDA